MDIYRLSSDLKFINQIGATLNIDERLKLELALQKLNESEKLDQILFWGKVDGTAKDYYIAIGLNFRGQYEFPYKKYFWTTSSDFMFAELPDFNPEYKTHVDEKNMQLFSGKHETILVQVTENQGENQEPANPEENQQNPEDSDEEVEIKVPPKDFTELDRLAYVVRAIDNDCSLAPIGAFKLIPTHELRYNDSFHGLNITEAAKICNYQHFRNPQSEEKKEMIDPIQEDLPNGCWSIQSDSSRTNVTIRSLLWPGYVGYHRANSNVFGGAYFGNGIKNVDLPFLL